MNIKPDPELAPGGIRLMNFVLDSVLKLGGGVVFLQLAGALGLTNLFQDFRTPGVNKYLVGLMWSFVYYVFFEGLFAQSPGKMITGTEVVTDEGKRPELNTVMLRTLCRFIPFNAFSFLFNADAIGWHDSLSKTRVVRKRM